MKLRLVILIGALFVCGVQPARAATLSVVPSSQTIKVGETATVTVRVNSGGQAVNAAEGTLTFSTEFLSQKSISKSGSIFTFWALEPSAKVRGQVGFIGGLPHPGYSGSAGTAFRLTLTGTAAGEAKVSFSGGKILADDGQGTNVLTSYGSATITVTAKETTQPTAPTTPTTPTNPSNPTTTTPAHPTPTISSPTHPSQTTWQPADVATVNISRANGLQGLSYVIDQRADTVPDQNAENVSGSLQIPLTGDGTWYVHVRGKYANGWSTTTTYIFQRDHTAPEPFTVHVSQDRGTADPSTMLVFSASDATSGIDGYTVQVDQSPPVAATSPYILEGLAAGKHTVVVTARDRAGNIRTTTTLVTTSGYAPPTIDTVSSPIMLLDTLTLSGMATLGDVVVIALDGETIGQVTAGAGVEPNPQVRVPWSFTSSRLLRPGRHTVTATALGPKGERSVATDSRSVLVSGHSVLFRGRAVATIAVVPAVAVGIILIVVLNAVVWGRLWWVARRLWRREHRVEDEIETLRERLTRERFSADQLDQQLAVIETDLAGPGRRVRKHRKPRKGSES